MYARVYVALAAVAAAFLAMSDCDFTTFIASSIGTPSYTNKVVWITGASSGIGEYLAYEFAAANATLILSARRGDRLKSVLERCVKLGAGANSAIESIDVAANVNEMPALVERVLQSNGFAKLDVLVLNAGATQRSLAADLPLSKVRDLFELNFFAVVEHAKAAIPFLAKDAQLVVTSSFTGKIGTPVSTAYSATKHALQGFFGGLRAELPDGVGVTILCPGPVRSEIANVAGVKESAENKMPTDRAAKLMLSAIWHRLYESWISPHPPLLFLHVGQYLPGLTTFLSERGPGRSRVNAFRAGVDIYSSAAYTHKQKA